MPDQDAVEVAVPLAEVLAPFEGKRQERRVGELPPVVVERAAIAAYLNVRQATYASTSWTDLPEKHREHWRSQVRMIAREIVVAQLPSGVEVPGEGAARLEAAALLLHVQRLGSALGAWSTRDELGGLAQVRKAANDAVAEVDLLLAALHSIRQRLIGEMRTADDAFHARLDAQAEARRAADAGKPLERGDGSVT